MGTPKAFVSMNNPKPPEYPTTQLAKPDRLEILFHELRVELRNSLGTHHDILLDLGDRMGRVEGRLNDHSIRAGQPSKPDLETASALAQEIEAREALAKKVDAQGELAEKTSAMLTENTAMTNEIKKAVTGFFTSKKVIFVGKVIWAAAMIYAAGKGIHVIP